MLSNKPSFPPYLRLGASLYVPGHRSQLVEIADGRKYPQLHSVIFCTEDSVQAQELPQVLDNLAAMLRQTIPHPPLLRFIRVRSPEILARCLLLPHISKIDGFVLPKVTLQNLDSYLQQFQRHDPFWVMPTLETQECFDSSEMRLLRQKMLSPLYRERILSLRIGGNDLLNYLGMRRERSWTIYETSLGQTISMLVNTFRPYGFNLTGPVCDFISAPQLLERETQLDLVHGLFGKGAIHPQQIALIDRQYRVSQEDFEAAKAILSPNRAAVFQMHGAMCEPATHARWAEQIVARASLYGILTEPSAASAPA